MQAQDVFSEGLWEPDYSTLLKTVVDSSVTTATEEDVRRFDREHYKTCVLAKKNEYCLAKFDCYHSERGDA